MGDDAARPEFLARAEELADALYADLRQLRGAAKGRERRAALDRAFRHAHTLKGTASASADAAQVVRLAHALEDVLDAARAGRVALGVALLDACESAADSLSRALGELARGVRTAGAGADESAERLRAELREAQTRPARSAENFPGPSADASGDAVDQAVESLPDEVAAQLGDAERRRLAAAWAEGARVVSVRAAFDLERLDEDFRRLCGALEASGEIVATLPGSQDADDSARGTRDSAARVSFNLICATDESPESLSRTLAEFGAEIVLLCRGLSEGADSAGVSSAAGGVEERSGVAGSLENESGGAGSFADEQVVAGGGDAHAYARLPEFARVPLAELDELAFVASELFDDTTAALEAARASADAAGDARADADELAEAALPSAAGAAGAAAEFERRAARLREDFLALEERVLALRMQPLAPALERAARAGRAAAREAGKAVEFEIAGGHARVDRVAAELIVGPLIHLLRNAVAHGIEPPRERRAAGKPERGRVSLRSTAEGASVRVSVEDDGRGIDLDGVERAARAAGLLAEGAKVTPRQALRLIFRPGFSTARSVTETSGRGVGLDAVERAVESAGGEVRVRTLAGRGTTFELRLPLAFALLPVALVESDGETYAIDAARVAEIAHLEPSAIIADGDGRRAVWRGRESPFVALASLLGRADGETSADFPRADGEGGRLSVVVLGLGEAGGAGSVVVAVDRVLGRRDALVRGLGRYATRWRGVGGAIDLRDGSVALLLDLASLVELKTVTS